MINYFSQVIRSQRVKKSLTLINITGLSVCIATALLIILYVWSELSYDSFHNTERVYRVESRLYEGKTLTRPRTSGELLRQEICRSTLLLHRTCFF